MTLRDTVGGPLSLPLCTQTHIDEHSYYHTIFFTCAEVGETTFVISDFTENWVKKRADSNCCHILNF